MIDFVNNIELSLNEWKKQKEIYNNPSNFTSEQIAFSTLYLSRTNFSGILKGGPIGGKSQSGKYRLDCRFNRKNLSDKIEKISSLSGKIIVENMDGIDLINKYGDIFENTFFYVDPPYFEKADNLYMNFFSECNHENLAKCLLKNNNKNWILTYDNVPQIADLYRDNKMVVYELLYSAKNKGLAREIMIYSDLISIPESGTV